MSVSWSTDILKRAQERGWLSLRQAASAASLIRHGLHPEQVLIGGGLADADSYGEVLSETTGLPFIRTMESSLTAPAISDDVCRAYHICSIAEDVTAAHLGCANPESIAQAQAEVPSRHSFAGALTWYCMLWSEWRKTFASGANGWVQSQRAAREFIQRLDKHGLHHVRVLPAADGLHVFSDEQPNFDELTELTARAWSGVRLRLRRLLASDGWRVREFETSHGRGFEMTRTSPHLERPHAWHWQDDAWLSDPHGLVVLIRPDAYVTQSVTEQATALNDLENWHTSSSKWNWKSVADDESAEEVLHAALSGLPVIAILPRASTHEWWQPAAHAGVPLRLIRRHRSPEGSAWEVLNYA